MPEEEAEIDGDVVPDTPVPLPIRSCLALVGPDLAFDETFPVGQFEVPADSSEADPVSVAIIAIAESDDKVVVAVPAAAWHRSLSRRILPLNSLLKPLPLTVDLCDRSGETTADGQPHFETAKVWIGLLAPSAEEYIVFDQSGEGAPADIPFSTSDPALVPSAPGLIAAHQQHFAFLTAASGSGGGGARPRAAADNPSLDKRLEALEQSVQTIAQSVQKLTSPIPAEVPITKGEACPLPPGLAFLPPKNREPPTLKPGQPRATSGDYDMVASARQAGVPEHQIEEMLKLAMKGRARLPDFPTSSKTPGRRNVLSESEDEEEEAAAAAGAAAGSGLPSGDPIVSALEKLTQIASHLTIEKKKGKTLDALLDGVGLGDASSSSSSGGTRRHAAALLALRKTLSKQPEEMLKAVEKNMVQDFHKVAQMPGSAPVDVTARAWLELRSRVQGYQTPVRFLWSVAGVLDCLRSGNVQEARARCCLSLAMGDQMSIDRGSWVVAGEIALEDPPPMAAFNTHTLPSEAEPPYTKLIDARWLELFLSKLSDVDNLNEKKKKLSARRAPLLIEADPKPSPKKSGKGGKSEKGGGKGSGGDKPPAAETS